MRLPVCLFLLTLLCGCQYDRSFMNINSDSGVPFFGLQMSVDASGAQKASTVEAPIQLVSSTVEKPTLVTESETTRAQSPDWDFLSASPKTPVEFPNPLADVATDEHPLTTVGRRLAAF